MIDIFTLALTHGLILLALLRLLARDELDAEGGAATAGKPWHKPLLPAATEAGDA